MEEIGVDDVAIRKGQTYQKAFHESERNLADYIYLIGKNNFPDRTPFNAKTVMEWVLPVILKRNVTPILKNILIR